MSSKLGPLALSAVVRTARHHSMFFGLFRHTFNEVDRDRLRTVGPDRLCAEWMLKNGGAVRLDTQPQFIVDYNALPDEDEYAVRVHQLDATGSSVTAQGFNHLRGCRHIDRIVLDDCPLLENSALAKLEFVANSLVELQVSNCPGIKDKGLLELAALGRLKKLCLFNLSGVKDIDAVEQELMGKLPRCQLVHECPQPAKCEAEN